uniref:lipoma-preferred partner homolog n=1 Tax=Oncorhynchus gorbuscha TaxID=8017 RepID=UPI001EAEA7FF|nr:lipoma-preferred partner homolog [Oncorhynchus gorbuscha]
MSGPTWPPPKTLGSPERPVPQMSDSGPAVYRQPPKKVSSDTRPKYVVHDQNRGGGMATRYLASGPTAGPMQHHHQEDPGFHPKSIDHYYKPPPQGLEEDHQLMGPPDKPFGHHSIIDAEIDSLTRMLDDLDSYSQNSTQLYDNVPYNKHITGDRYKPSAQPGAPSQGRLFMGLPPHPQHQYRPTPPFPEIPCTSPSQTTPMPMSPNPTPSLSLPLTLQPPPLLARGLASRTKQPSL